MRIDLVCTGFIDRFLEFRQELERGSDFLLNSFGVVQIQHTGHRLHGRALIVVPPFARMQATTFRPTHYR